MNSSWLFILLILILIFHAYKGTFLCLFLPIWMFVRNSWFWSLITVWDSLLSKTYLLHFQIILLLFSNFLLKICFLFLFVVHRFMLWNILISGMSKGCVNVFVQSSRSDWGVSWKIFGFEDQLASYLSNDNRLRKRKNVGVLDICQMPETLQKWTIL